jgi:ubiquinone/menaquinone biosynthesis C-methylase UbiE
MLKIARKKQIKNVRFLHMDAHNLEFSDKSFQNIFSIATLEFVQNPDLVWSEINRVLIPGGYFLIGALNLHSMIGKTKDQDPVFRNANFFTPESLKQRLDKIGIAKIQGTLVMDEQFQIKDEKDMDQQYLLENGCFLVGLAQKR